MRSQHDCEHVLVLIGRYEHNATCSVQTNDSGHPIGRIVYIESTSTVDIDEAEVELAN